MTPSIRALRALTGLVAALALLLSSRCGPTTVVARLVTPAAETPRPTATATPRLERPRATPPATATSTPLPAPTPTLRPAPRRVLPAPTVPSATPTAAPPSATPSPTRPVASATPTSTPVPATATATPRPIPSASPSPKRTPAPPVPSPLPPSPTPTAPSPSPLEPASAAATLPGEWDFRANTGKGIIAGTLRFRSTSSGLAGLYIGLHGNATELSNLRAAGSGVSFDLVTPTAVWHLDGTVSSDSIDGTFRTAERTIRWTALRKPAPPTPTPRP